MKLRTEDALGYFSTQMLGSLALPSVTREAVRRGDRIRISERERADKDGVGYVAHVDRASGRVDVVAGPAEDLPGEPLTASLYRAALTTGEHRFRLDEVRTYGSLDAMDAALSSALPGMRGSRKSGKAQALSLAEKARALVEQYPNPRGRAAPETVFVRCDCSRVVPLEEWVYPYDCCEDCAERLGRVADNWRWSWEEADRERLIAEFTD